MFYPVGVKLFRHPMSCYKRQNVVTNQMWSVIIENKKVKNMVIGDNFVTKCLFSGFFSDFAISRLVTFLAPKRGRGLRQSRPAEAKLAFAHLRGCVVWNENCT